MSPTPIACPLQTVDEQWIDYNGHMNMAFYNLAFDRALDHVYDSLGIGEDYVREHGGSVFTREVHVNYLRELRSGDPIRVTFQLLKWDSKRMHFFERMHHAEEDYLAATSEQLALHVSMASRRTAPFPQHIQTNLQALYERHCDLAIPEQVGQVMGIPEKSAQ